jgi:hypothetical protein
MAGWDFLFVPYQDPKNSMAWLEHAVFQNPQNFLDYEEVQEWDGLNDCAHFLSRCLHALGIDGAASPVVAILVDHLDKRTDTRILAVRVNRAQGQKLIDSGMFKKGDVIAYFDEDKKQYLHSAMFVGYFPDKPEEPAVTSGRIACHTVCRLPGKTGFMFSDQWHLKDAYHEPHNYSYTFIHFTADDQHVRHDVHAFAGWWRIGASDSQHPSGPAWRYQYNDLRGWSYSQMHAPTGPGDVPHGRPKGLPSGMIANRAYWFYNGFYTIIWGNCAVDYWAGHTGTSWNDVSLDGRHGWRAFRMF